MMAAQVHMPNGYFNVAPQMVCFPPAPPHPTTLGFHQVFLRGQPKALGTTQILLAFLYVALGSTLIFAYNGYNGYIVPLSIYTGVIYWAALFYLISGSLSIAAENNQSLSLVKGSLAMNIISAIVCLPAFSILIIDVIYANKHYYSWCNYYSCWYQSIITQWIALSFLIIATILQFSVAVSLSAFGCKALSQNTSIPRQVFVISNDYRAPRISPVPVAYTDVNPYNVPQSNEPQGHTPFPNPMDQAGRR